MSVSWHQASSPLYPAQANLKREKEREGEATRRGLLESGDGWEWAKG